MSEKLELKYLQGYLTYGLKIYQRAYGQDLIREMTCMDLMNLADGQTGYKPLLIPLSSLTQEQWIEVFKAGTTTQLGHIVSGNDLVGCTADNCYLSFNLRCNCFDGLWTFNQLAAFNKLYSLHADLHDLIGKKLALNALTYGK